MTANETVVPAPERSCPCVADRLNAGDLNAGDLDGLVAMYEPSASSNRSRVSSSTATPPSAHALEELLAIDPTITAETVEVLAASDAALVVNEWAMTDTAPDGTDVRQGGRGADVVQRQPDDRWLLVVDKP